MVQGIGVIYFDWSEAFARWIFDTMVIDGRTYEIINTEEESTPSRIVAEYLGIVQDEYGWDFHKFRLHLPAGVDASFSMILNPISIMTPSEWTPTSVTF